MGSKTSLWLFLAAALLAGVIVWQRGREEEQGLGLTDIALFDGVETARVQAIVVDHLERGLQLRLERDGRGIWYITDPILYAAEPGVVSLLLDTISESRALFVPEVEQDPEQLGFDPPRAVFTIEEQRDDEVVRHTVELGYLDLDGKLVNVRKDGRYLRILRKLDTTLKRGVDDFRSQRVLQTPGNSITAVNRWGRVQESVSEDPVELHLNAVLDGDTWRALAPFQAALDPLAFSVLLHGAGGLRVDRFVEDDPEDLAIYGLDEPLFQVELQSSDGGRELLTFGRGSAANWFAKRASLPNVYGISQEDMLRVLIPNEELIEQRVMRVAREAIDAIRLESPDVELRLQRTAEGWTVSERALGADSFGPAFPGEEARVQQLLAELEHMELLGHRLNESFPADAPRRAVIIEAGGELHGGRVGPELVDDDGEPACWFQRSGDEIVSIAPLALRAATEAQADAYRSLDIALTTEIDVLGLEFEYEDQRLRFTRGERGRWTAAGSDEEARELLAALDALLFLRASAHAGELTPGDLEAPVRVKFDLRDGKPAVQFRIGRVPSAGEGAYVERLGAVARLNSDSLHDQLISLFGG